MVDEIKTKYPDIDLSGYYMELSPDNLKHSFDGHSTAKQKNDINLSEKDYQNIPQYFDDYDDLLYIHKYKNNEVKLAVGKQINGHSVIIEVVSKSRGSLVFKNMFGNETSKYL